MSIRAIYLDIGGVLLTNGWDSASRKKAAAEFGLNFEEMNSKHRLMFGAHELGKLSLDTYLDYVVFDEKRKFSKEDFKKFMYAQSQPHVEMIDLIRDLKKKHHLKIGLISNEGLELTLHRVQWLVDFTDFFCVSCFVHVKKPDPTIFQLALDLGQIPANQVAYIEDRKLYADLAKSLGFKAIHHTDVDTTKKQLFSLL